MTDRVAIAGREVLAGRRRGVRALLPFAGPAVIASVAYMDPGNFATNIQAGATFNYDLLWVALLANLIAMLFQALSAKLGIVTGRNLAELCRANFPRPIVLAMWVASEIAAMATDLAEFLGAAIGLSLLFGWPLMVGMVATGLITYAILLADRGGFRPLELIIGAMVAVIGACYLAELWIAPIDWWQVARHSVLPSLDGGAALTLAVGIVGATVMPHAIYLHSSLTQDRIAARSDGDRRALIRYSNREVMIALTFAGLVNMAMIATAAAAFHDGSHDDVAEIETAYHTLIPILGGGAAAVFMISLLASGVSSSVVGTLAGGIIMQGFVGYRIPVFVRRLLTMLPAFVVVALGVKATDALIYSQVVLSMGLPIPMIALILLAGRRDLMGDFAIGRRVGWLMTVATIIVIALNAVLILQAFGLVPE